ncbi:MAG TPA: alpha/beta fold hydrolase [Anaerolineae bacterium]|nr:alpha/beta fold hydrolase [Anaerolineae bacterium]
MTKRRISNLLTLPIAVAAGWIGYSALGIDRRQPLPDAILADKLTFLSKAGGWLNAYVDRSAAGRPLVLIHSVNAAASAYEMGPLFRHYRGKRPVYALDLPGYGQSNRLQRDYTPQLFADAIAEFLETQVGEPADVVGLSLGCEFVARAALARPELFHSLAFISPSGLGSASSGRASQQTEARGIAGSLHSALAFPLWGRALFDLIATRRSIEFFLSKSFEGPVTPGFVDYGYATAHQPGAEHVPLRFIAGMLFTPDAASTLYEKLAVPTLALYDQDYFVGFDALPQVVQANPRWQAVRIAPTRGLPHFEKLAETAAALDTFWHAGQT